MLNSAHHRRTGGYYAAFSYGAVVVTAYLGFFLEQHFYTAAHWVPVVFALGGIYAALGVLCSVGQDCGLQRGPWFYVVQSCLLTGIVLLSPARGFMGIVVLPLLSQGIFDLRPRVAVVLALFLLVVVTGVWAIPYGWSGVARALMNYAAAFVFTIAFSLITKQAVFGRIREAELRYEVEAANRQLRAYAVQAEELATTRERNRLAREIHDGVGHYLTVVKTQLDAAAALLPDQPERARDVVVKAAKLSGDALDDVRRSVGTLRTDAVRPPLPEALRALGAETGLPVAVRVEGPARPLSAAVDHALFRAAQEGLTNVRKHAAASAVEVVLDFRAPDRVALAVTDNGSGRPVTAAAGFGLQGIKERIEVLGGSVTSGNGPERGFALTIEVPA